MDDRRVPPKRVTVAVTEKDIEQGMRGSCSSCPVALAATRAVGERMTITGYSAETEAEPFYRYRLPAGVSSFIYNFDNRYGVEPLEFVMEHDGVARVPKQASDEEERT